MRSLITKVLLGFGSFALSYAVLCLVMLQGPLSASRVSAAAEVFVSDPSGVELIKSGVSKSLRTAGVDETVVDATTSKLFSNPEFLRAVSWELSSSYATSLGETPSPAPPGVSSVAVVVQDSLRTSGVPKGVADKVVVKLPSVKLPFASYLHNLASRMWLRLFAAAFSLFALAAVTAPDVFAVLRYVGRRVAQASFFYAALGLLLPLWASQQGSALWHLIGEMARVSFRNLAIPSLVALVGGLVLSRVKRSNRDEEALEPSPVL
jgi:hypothetical protein